MCDEMAFLGMDVIIFQYICSLEYANNLPDT